MPIINVPGLGQVSFPDGTPKETMEAAIRNALMRRQEENQLEREQAASIGETPEFLATKGAEAESGRASFGKFALRAAPSLALGAGLLAGAAKLGLGPMATVATEALAGGAGEAAGQAITGEEIDPAAIAVGAAFPGAVRGAQAGTRGLFQFLTRRAPGAETIVREQALKRVEALPPSLRPSVSSDDLYKALRNAPEVKIKMSNTISEAETLGMAEEDILPGLQSAAIKRATKGAKKKFSTATEEQVIESPILGPSGERIQKMIPAKPDEGIDFAVAQANLKRLGKRIRDAESGKTLEDAGALRQFRGAVMRDMEQAGDKFPLLKAANEAFKKEAAADEFGEMIALAKKSQGEFDVINVDTLRDRFNRAVTRDRLFREGLGEENTKKINEFLKTLETQASKAGKVGTVVLFGGLGAATASSLGLEGAGATIAGVSTAFFGPEAVETILLSDWGRRNFLRLMQEGKGRISRPAIAILANTIRAGQENQ